MKKAIVTLTIIVVVFILLFAAGPFYILQEGQVAVVTRLGAIVKSETEAGLKLKMPVIDTVHTYTKKLITWNGEPQRIPTSEQQFIWVDTTARWRIADPELFYKSMESVDLAQARISPIIDASVKNVIAENPLREAVRDSNYINTGTSRESRLNLPSDLIGETDIDLEAIPVDDQKFFDNIEKGRSVLSGDMFIRANQVIPQFGIALEDIIIRQIRYSDDLSQSVYNRMIVERNKEAATRRSTGEGVKAEWLGKLENEKRTILSQAYNTSQEIMGQADAKAAAIYAEAAQRDPEFYRFWRSIESYRKTLPEFPKILSTDMDYFQYLYKMDRN